MRSNVVDLSRSDVDIPTPVIVDTNVVSEWALASYHDISRRSARAPSFFQHLVTSNQEAILTPIAYSEFLHVAILARYKRVFR